MNKRREAFLSSAMTGELNEERIAIRKLFKIKDTPLERLFTLYAVEEHSGPKPIYEACIYEVSRCDLFILILNEELRDVVREEYEQAIKNEKTKIFVYLKNNANANTDLVDFITNELYPKFQCGQFDNVDELIERINNDIEYELSKGFSAANSNFIEQPITNNVVSNESTSFTESQLKPFFKSLSKDKKESEFTAFIWVLKGLVEYDEQKYEESIKSLNTAIDKGHKNPVVYSDIGAAYMRLKKYTKAIEAYTQAINIDGNYFQAYNDRGLAKKSLKAYQDALNDFTKAISIKSDEAPPLNNRGNVYCDLKEYEKAKLDFLKALEIEKDSWIIYFDLASMYYELKDYDKTLENYKKSFDLNPDEPRINNNIGSTYLALYKPKEAIPFFTKAVTLEKTNSSYHENLATAYCETGNYIEGFKHLNKSIKLQHDRESVYFKKGTYNLLQKNYSEALNDLNKAIELKSDYFQAYAHRASVYSAMGEHDRAIEDYLKTIEFDKSEVLNYLNLAELYFYLGLFEEGHKLLKKAQYVSKNNKFTVILLFLFLLFKLHTNKDYQIEENIIYSKIEESEPNNWNFDKIEDILVKLQLPESQLETINSIIEKMKAKNLNE